MLCVFAGLVLLIALLLWVVAATCQQEWKAKTRSENLILRVVPFDCEQHVSGSISVFGLLRTGGYPADVGKMKKDDVRKKEYARSECAGIDPFVAPVGVEEDVKAAIWWQASRTAVEIMNEREEVIVQLELANHKIKESGAHVLVCVGYLW